MFLDRFDTLSRCSQDGDLYSAKTTPFRRVGEVAKIQSDKKREHCIKQLRHLADYSLLRIVGRCAKYTIFLLVFPLYLVGKIVPDFCKFLFARGKQISVKIRAFVNIPILFCRDKLQKCLKTFSESLKKWQLSIRAIYNFFPQQGLRLKTLFSSSIARSQQQFELLKKIGKHCLNNIFSSRSRFSNSWAQFSERAKNKISSFFSTVSSKKKELGLRFLSRLKPYRRWIKKIGLPLQEKMQQFASFCYTKTLINTGFLYSFANRLSLRFSAGFEQAKAHLIQDFQVLNPITQMIIRSYHWGKRKIESTQQKIGRFYQQGRLLILLIQQRMNEKSRQILMQLMSPFIKPIASLILKTKGLLRVADCYLLSKVEKIERSMSHHHQLLSMQYADHVKPYVSTHPLMLTGLMKQRVAQVSQVLQGWAQDLAIWAQAIPVYGTLLIDDLVVELYKRFPVDNS